MIMVMVCDSCDCDVCGVQFEEAAKEAADEVTRPRPEGEELRDIQVLLHSDANPIQIRDLRVCSRVSVLFEIPYSWLSM